MDGDEGENEVEDGEDEVLGDVGDDPLGYYASLGLTKGCSSGEVKRAYHRLALRLHPDKNPGDAEAAGRFQAVQKVYGVLGDVKRRALYDAHGVGADDEGGGVGGDFDDLKEYYRTAYVPVTEAEIERFAEQYRGSEEERADVLRYYGEREGRMDEVMQFVMCSTEDDAPRFAAMVDAAVEAGEVAGGFAAYDAWAARARRRKPSGSGSKGRAGLAGRGKAAEPGMDLVAMLQANRDRRGAKFDDFMSSLEARYAGVGKMKGKAGPAKGKDRQGKDRKGKGKA